MKQSKNANCGVECWIDTRGSEHWNISVHNKYQIHLNAFTSDDVKLEKVPKDLKKFFRLIKMYWNFQC